VGDQVDVVMELTDTSTSILVGAGGTEICRYVYRPEMPTEHSPRPYAHPVRTLRGVTVTDAVPTDHPWHYGISLAIPLIAGSSFWGGPTYVDGLGYVAIANHGHVDHREWLDLQADGDTATLHERLLWRDHRGAPLLDEERTLVFRMGDGDVWSLDLRTHLCNGTDTTIAMDSPTSLGRPSAGYGGLFLRLAPDFQDSLVVDTDGRRGEDVFGSNARAVTMGSVRAEVAVNADEVTREPWFIRRSEYPGICAALAFERSLTLPSSASMSRSYRITVADLA
jgi:Methane oxygenase PmoA